MANLLFDLPVMGRELPRAQRWLDNTDVDDVRVDPGMTQAAYLDWERGADISDPSLIDWDTPVDVEELYGYALTAELPWTWTDAVVMDEVVHDQAAPYAAYDIWVTVNGRPLEAWLALGNPESVEIWDDLVKRFAHQYVLEQSGPARVAPDLDASHLVRPQVAVDATAPLVGRIGAPTVRAVAPQQVVAQAHPAQANAIARLGRHIRRLGQVLERWIRLDELWLQHWLEQLADWSECHLCGEDDAFHTVWEDGSVTCPDALYGKEVN